MMAHDGGAAILVPHDGGAGILVPHGGDVLDDVDLCADEDDIMPMPDVTPRYMFFFMSFFLFL